MAQVLAGRTESITTIRKSFVFSAIALAAATAVWSFASGTVRAPGPADLKSPLYGSNGATADAVFVNTGVASKILLWPSTYTSCGAYCKPVGTPCSNVGMGTGDRTTKHLVAYSPTSVTRKCVENTQPLYVGQPVVRPYPTPVLVVDTSNGMLGVQHTVTGTRVVKWPTYFITQSPLPAAGTPCSPTDMLAGEATSMWIQAKQNSGLRRCVSLTEPSVVP